MTAAHLKAPPAYVVDADGTVQVNAAGAALKAQRAAIAAQFRQLMRGWARAEIAALFVRHPSVLAFDLHLRSDWEYDDSGGCFSSGSCTVENVQLDAGSPRIDEFLEDGEPQADLAAAILESELEEKHHDLAMVILGEDGSDDRRETYHRADMLALIGFHPGTAPPSPAGATEPSPSC